jgi:hypothetical protein
MTDLTGRRSARLVPVLVLAGLTGAALLLAGATAVEEGGAAPYTPTCGEWLCLELNTHVAVVTAEQKLTQLDIRFLHDKAKPDLITIELLNDPSVVSLDGLRAQARRARDYATKRARRHGWDKWLKLEVKRVKR